MTRFLSRRRRRIKILGIDKKLKLDKEIERGAWDDEDKKEAKNFS